MQEQRKSGMIYRYYRNCISVDS